MSNEIPFSNKPGRHERHLQRRIDNPNFGASAVSLTDEILLEAQKKDHEELVAFVDDLRQLVSQAVNLKSNESSDIILKLKEKLDIAYDKSCTLADEQGANQQAITQLISIIMTTIRQAAGNDSQALQELDDEDIARSEHHQMIESHLIADLLDPDSLIQQSELTATLISSTPEELKKACVLFDQAQLQIIASEAEILQKDIDTSSSNFSEQVKENIQIIISNLDGDAL